MKRETVIGAGAVLVAAAAALGFALAGPRMALEIALVPGVVVSWQRSLRAERQVP